MKNFSNCQMISQIYESSNSLVYRANHDNNNQPVILKILKEDYPTPAEITRYKQEYEITCSLNIEGVIRAYDLQKYQNTLAIVLEDFGGESLDIITKHRKLSLPEFLEVAIKITKIIGEIHAANVIHKDINPANIIWNIETNIIKIIDFGISTVFTRENPTIKNPNILEGTLAYMSPEQTGRMNRALDYTTDFYSLGATFYRILTGYLPFDTGDALELVHCHIAKQPIPPHELDPNIPKAVSNLILKLLAKTAEERYQSAFGIVADLEECLRQFQSKGEIADFPLAQQDFSERFSIPQKLYGREQEIERLLSTFARINSENSSQEQTEKSVEIILVSGYSGIGKSALVQELYKPITQQRGYFISGKFEQFKRNIPYSAIAAAFRSLVQQILAENEAQLSEWREKLLEVFGSNGQAIIEVIPEVELIVGPQPPIQQLEPMEAQNRFNLIFQKFVRVFCQKSHPLVIFLDDLQWADSASLKAIELMLSDEQMKYLLIIGAYRDNEVSPSHPSMLTLNRLEKEGVILNKIILAPLGAAQIAQLITDTLHSNLESLKPLADLIHRKTSGNPFFINEFLKTIYQENLLNFDRQQHCWVWEIEQIDALGITENVVDLLINKLKKIPDAPRQALLLAACIGNSFDLKTLSVICEKSLKDTFEDLLPAIQFGLIQPTSSLENTSNNPIDSSLVIQNYKFLHDRVQQAAYSSIDENRKETVHLKIGRLLLENTLSDELAGDIFAIVDHLNKGKNLLESKAEKVQLSQLNLKAGKKAKEATAYTAAREYLISAKEIFPGNIWRGKNNYKIAIELYKELAQIEYLNSNFQESELLIKFAINKANSAIERAEFYYLLIELSTMQGKYLQAIEFGRTALAQLGIDFPDRDFNKAVEAELGKFSELLENREVASLIDNREMEDPIQQIALELLIKMLPPAYLGAPEISGVVMSKSANLSVEYGHTSKSAISYGIFGMLQAILGNYQLSYQLTLLGYQLSKKFNDLYSLSQTANTLANVSLSWVKHIKQTENINAESIEAGLNSGMLQYAGFSMTHSLLNGIYQGKNLSLLPKEASGILPFCQKTKNQWSVDCILGQKIVLQNLLGQTQNKVYFGSDEINESDYLNQEEVSRTPNAICYYYIFKAQALYLYGEWQLALSSIAKAQELSAFIAGTIYASTYNFYYSLILAALHPSASPEEQQEYWTQLEINQAQMKTWANNCPENFLHKYLLVAAEMTGISGNWYEAINLYEQAIKLAKENEFIHEEALANELTAKFWFAQEKPEFAQIYLKKARQGYQIWGAKRKEEDLDEKYVQWLGSTGTDTPSNTIKTVTTTGSNSGEVLDFAAVMKASQAISGEIVLEQLLNQVMKAVLANAGAQKGFLILDKDGNLVIEAQAAIESDHISILQSIPIDSREPATGIPLLSAGIVNYVARSHENVVLNNATEEGQFTRDAYILATQPKSILCTPLLDRGKLAGILYLENNLAISAFTPQRVETLKIIAAQAAISIENAQLYEQLEIYNRTLEQKVEERTKELSHTLEILKATQAELVIENALLRSAEEPPGYDYQVGGSLPIDAPTYVVRSADRHLYKALRLGQLCYILNTRQMGKSSLRVQIMKKLQAEGFVCTAIDISVLSSAQSTLEQWYAGFAYLLVSGLNLLGKVNIRAWWRERELLSSVQRLSEFINEVLLTAISEKIIIFIDEIDSVLDLPFDNSPFFSIIRTCYNKRADSSDYQRLNFVLLGVATPSQLIQDRNHTPFNVGQAIQLKGFQVHEAQPLLQGLTKRVTNPQTLLKEVIAWTGGQPFLTQKVCKLICNSESPIPTNDEAVYVENLVRSQIIENWESQDHPEHLRTIRDRILKDEQRVVELLTLYRQILHQGQIVAVDNSAEAELLMSGIVVKQGNYLQVNNRIYELIFDDAWIEKHISHYQRIERR
jgi:predicted ATPase/GAF domain-containing protein/tRNA A-37 threonylcarbamoyl transferase component Bud32